MKWFAVGFECPADKAPCILRVAAYSADTELQFSFQCHICNETFNWRIFAAQLTHRAFTLDMEAQKTNKKLNRAIGQEISRIVRPPLAKPQFTPDDLKWLHEFHVINEESDGTR